MSVAMSATLHPYLALTIEQRIELVRRLPPGYVHDGSQPREDLFDLFGPEGRISPRTFHAYGMKHPGTLGRPRPSADVLSQVAPPCQWLTDFQAYFRNASNCQQPLFAPPNCGVCDVLWPVINAAVGDVQQFLLRCRMENPTLHIDAGRVLDHTKVVLYAKIFATCARAVVVELGAAHARNLLHGNTPQARFSFFVECLRETSFSRKILEQYPVLIRQAVTLACDWRDALVEFLGRLACDWSEISKNLFDGGELGTLHSVELSAGDRHNKGRTVILLEFENGKKVVYKPRSLTIDGHFAHFVDWVNAREPDLLLATCAVIDKTTYGWSAFVEPRACTEAGEVTEFYRRQGANLALLYLLGACDLHSENLIADGATPKLIDLETLFHPILLPDDISGATKQAFLFLNRSVLRTGLLPYRSKYLSSPDDWIDLSGMGNVEEREIPFKLPLWEDFNTDQMRLVYSRQTANMDQNLPILSDKRVGPESFVDEIIDGFSCAYRLFCTHRNDLLAPDGPIHRFKGNKIRVVARPTLRYELLLGDSFHPECLTDALAKEAFFDSLWEEASEHYLLARLMPAERRDLWRGDVPYFSTRTDSVDLWTSTGERIANALEVSGHDTTLTTHRRSE